MTYFVIVKENIFIPDFIEIHQGDRLQFIWNNSELYNIKFLNLASTVFGEQNLSITISPSLNYWYPGVGSSWCEEVYSGVSNCSKTIYFFYSEVFYRII